MPSSFDRHRAAMDRLLQIPGVTSVGYGLKEAAGRVLRVPAYRVYVRSKRPLSALDARERVPTHVDGFPTDVLRRGAVTDLSQRTLVTGARTHSFFASTSSFGTLGLVVQREARQYGLTNKHVVGPWRLDSFGDPPAFRPARVFSPERKNPETLRPPIGVTLEADQFKGEHLYNGLTYELDAALIELAADLRASNHVQLADRRIDLTTIHDSIASGDDMQYPLGARVSKLGARTGLTTGEVTEIVDRSTGRENWRLRIQLVEGGGFGYDQVLAVMPMLHGHRRDIDALVHELNHITGLVAENRTTDPDLPEIRVHGAVLALSGDSGAVWFDSTTGVVVGLNFSVSGVQLLLRGSAAEEGFGDSLACHIGAVFDRLHLPATAIVPPARPAFREAEPEPCPPPEAVQAAHTAMLATAGGKHLLRLSERHYPELAELIHHRRRVMVTWHRFKGPAFLVAFARAVAQPDAPLPREIAGVSLVELLHRMRDVLLVEGGPALGATIRSHGTWLLAIAEQATSMDAMRGALEHEP